MQKLVSNIASEESDCKVGHVDLSYLSVKLCLPVFDIPDTLVEAFWVGQAFRVNEDAFCFKIHLHMNAAYLMRRVSLILLAVHVPHAFDAEYQVCWDLLPKSRSQERENCLEGISVKRSDAII